VGPVQFPGNIRLRVAIRSTLRAPCPGARAKLGSWMPLRFYRSLALQYIPEEIQNGDMLEICKFPGIKKDTAASSTGFQPDMGLPFVKDLIHFDTAFRAINIIYFVKFLADFFASAIKDLIGHPLLQHFFQHIGFAEQTKTILTAVDPYFMPIRHFVHFSKTLWTFHRLALLQ
jgi:hypothetical protein